MCKLSLVTLSSVLTVLPVVANEVKKEIPNILIIYVDDLGYGDIACQRPDGDAVIQTPNIDRLAKEGMRFTSAYAAASTCTPSRYSLLTGEYSFRKAGTGVLQGDAGMIIEPGRQTLPGILQQAGYYTGVVGKWHLGLEYKQKVNWNQPIKNGPQQIGFDYSFILPATNDRVPFVFLENQQVVNADPNDPIQVNYQRKIGNDPTGRENPNLLKLKFSHGHDGTIINGVSRIGFMTGGIKARLVDEDIPQQLVNKSAQFIDQSVKKNQPFFLYLSTIDIHVPRVPHSRFLGKSGLGVRGDVILQLDWTVGEVYKMLAERNLLENTMIIFTSDNGPFLDDGYADKAIPLAEKYNYNPAGVLSGHKYSCFEGGVRVPFIIRYPKKVKAGQISDAIISQVDLLASFAKMVGKPVNTQSAPDSQDHLAVLFGRDLKGRESVLFESCNGPVLRKGDWKYWNAKRSGYMCPKSNGLYNIRKDITENKKNNYFENAQYSEIKQELDTLYRQSISKK